MQIIARIFYLPICYFLLLQQLMALLIVRQVIGNFKEALLPYLMWHLRMIKAGLIMTVAESPEKECSEQTSLETNVAAGSAAPDDPVENLINGNLDPSSKAGEEEKKDKSSSKTETDSKNGKGDLPENLENLELPARKPSSNLSPSQAEVESTMSQVGRRHFC